jgi:hypothetical protein
MDRRSSTDGHHRAVPPRDFPEGALQPFGPTARRKYNYVLLGTGKKNGKSSNLIFAALFKLLIPESSLQNGLSEPSGLLLALGRTSGAMLSQFPSIASFAFATLCLLPSRLPCAVRWGAARRSAKSSRHHCAVKAKRSTEKRIAISAREWETILI